MSLQLLTTQDQGFEAGIGTWVAQPATGNCSIVQTAAQAHSGTKSLSISSTAGGTMSAWTGNYPVMPGRTYAWSAWWRTAVSARATIISLYWFQSDGTTASALHANDDAALAADSNSAWTQSALGSVTAPLDATFVKVRAQVTTTGAGSEVHYLDDVTLQDVGAPYFKHGRTAMLWVDSTDLSPYFASAEMSAKVATADVSVFQNTWKQYIPGMADSSLVVSGYYDSALTAVRATLQQIPPAPVVTFCPGGAFAVGDPARLMQANSTDYKEGGKVGGAVTHDLTMQGTGVWEEGSVLHVLQQETGTITGTGAPLDEGVSTTTGAVAHLHVMALSGGTLSFKLQDATALNNAYTDIASGAFTNVTAAGSQRLIVPGTIRAYVRAVATLGASTCTYSIVCART